MYTVYSLPNRTRTDIISEMLETIQRPVNKTFVMYTSKLSYDQLLYYRDLLISNNLMTIAFDKWVITEKGKSYLKATKTAKEILDT